MVVICLSSQSSLKVAAVKTAFSNYYNTIDIFCYSTANAPIPEQPINTGNKCAKLRNEYMKQQINREYDYLVSIENEIYTGYGFSNCVTDRCHIVIEDASGVSVANSSAISGQVNVEKSYYDKALEQTDPSYEYFADGLAVTIGSMIHAENPEIPANDWFSAYGESSRETIMINILDGMLAKIADRNRDLSKLRAAVIRVPDFPKPGVVFQDLSDILVNPELLDILVDQMTILAKMSFFDGNINSRKVKVMGLDARGFIYGSLVASKLGAGFIMARKKGKLPGETIEQEYGTEYSKACIEIMPHLISEGDPIIIVDDLVATGGSLKAAVDLARQRGGKVIGCLTVLQVDALVEKAREKLAGIPLAVLVK